MASKDDDDQAGRAEDGAGADGSDAAGQSAARQPRAGRPRDNHVGIALRSAYDEAVREQVPDEFLDLLGKLS